jgi:anti-anti-sigma regulatory factor
MALSYFINRKQTTCVISLTGSLKGSDAEVLDACLKEATSSPVRYFVLNLAGMQVDDIAATRPFTIFQQGLRAGFKLYLCNLQPEAYRLLRTGGIIREPETMPDLLSALQAIMNEEKG